MKGRVRVKVGGLWYRRRDEGHDVVSGTFVIADLERALAEMKRHGNLVSVVLFDNASKTKASEPDLVMYVEPRIPIEGVRSA